MFVLGLLLGLAGTIVWPLAALGWIPYPGLVHRALMIEGFEQSFIAGFLLTALGGILHGGQSTRTELALVFLAQVAAGVAALASRLTIAHGAFLFGMLVLVAAAARRARRGRSRGRPPRELAFILTALALGTMGGAVLVTGSVRGDGAALLFGSRLLSLGHVLGLVVGVGSMLVPTFLGHKRPDLMVPAVKPAWTSHPLFHPTIAILLGGSFALEAAGMTVLGAAARALATTAVLFGLWGIHRRSAAEPLAWCLRIAGFAVLAGLWLAVVVPSRPLLGEHVVFVGGYGFLTMGIATRVVVGHGGWPRPDESRLLHPAVLVVLALALATRAAAELAPAQGPALWAWSGLLWALAWLGWSVGAVPRILTRKAPGS
jgi:uncharacterized protein involved in response to NO